MLDSLATSDVLLRTKCPQKLVALETGLPTIRHLVRIVLFFVHSKIRRVKFVTELLACQVGNFLDFA